jgi:hypothetical protein
MTAHAFPYRAATAVGHCCRCAMSRGHLHPDKIDRMKHRISAQPTRSSPVTPGPRLSLPPYPCHIEVADWRWPTWSMDKLPPDAAAALMNSASKAAATLPNYFSSP